MSGEVGLSTSLFLVDSITGELSLGEVENWEIVSKIFRPFELDTLPSLFARIITAKELR